MEIRWENERTGMMKRRWGERGGVGNATERVEREKLEE